MYFNIFMLGLHWENIVEWWFSYGVTGVDIHVCCPGICLSDNCRYKATKNQNNWFKVGHYGIIYIYIYPLWDKHWGNALQYTCLLCCAMNTPADVHYTLRLLMRALDIFWAVPYYHQSVVSGPITNVMAIFIAVCMPYKSFEYDSVMDVCATYLAY